MRGAAQELGVHHTTVSHRIDRFEERLGAALFACHPDGFVLTSAGETLTRAGRDFGDAVIEGRRKIYGQDDALSGMVAVTPIEPLFTRLFAPRLPDFLAAHPELEL